MDDPNDNDCKDFKIGCDFNSETKYVKLLKIKKDETIINFLDTPGFFDT